MRQITEEKFKAIQVLIDDFSLTGSKVYYYTDDGLDFTIWVTNRTKTVKMEMTYYKATPVRRIAVTYKISDFRMVEYGNIVNVINEMERSVRP